VRRITFSQPETRFIPNFSISRSTSSAAWAARYGGNYEYVDAFLAESIRAERGQHAKVDLVPQQPRVFISYRREESKYQAKRIHDALVKVLPPKNVFMDVDTVGEQATDLQILL
jgi:hypothetical protein